MLALSLPIGKRGRVYPVNLTEAWQVVPQTSLGMVQQAVKVKENVLAVTQYPEALKV